MALDFEEQQDIQVLNTVLSRSHIRVGELWLHYYSIGGMATQGEVEAHVNGLMSLPQLERKLLQLAAEEINAPG
ncbi:hypothetical protein [Arthrobacter sp. UYCo732]|uniref:hypothetical protein n=1 Tax=Arthrobacter sp. UYCo732 TaxID=3156336 RepID=UPI00339AE629